MRIFFKSMRMYKLFVLFWRDDFKLTNISNEIHFYFFRIFFRTLENLNNAIRTNVIDTFYNKIYKK